MPRAEENICAFLYGLVCELDPEDRPPPPRMKWTAGDLLAATLGYVTASILDGTLARQLRAQEEAERSRAEAERDRQREAESTARLEDAAGLLGVSVDADMEGIRRAFRERVRRVHPDLNGGDGEATRRLIAARDLMIAERHEGRR